MLNRIIQLVLLLLLGAAVSAASELTETDVLAVLGEQHPRVRILEAQLERARAEEQAAALWRNPRIDVHREQTSSDEGGDPADDFIEGSLPVDVSGRRGLRRRAAVQGREGAEHVLAWELHSLRADVRLAFYRALWAQARVQELQGAQQRLTSVVESARSRSSPQDYATLRLQRELAEAGTEAELARQSLIEERSVLDQWLAPAMRMQELAGALGPTGALPARSELEADLLPNHPRLLALLREAEQRRLEWQASRRGWIPEVEIGGGWKRTTADSQTDQGFTAGVSFEVPIFNRGQAEARRDRATLLQAEQHRLLGEQHIRVVFAQAYETAALTHRAWETYRNDAVPQADALEQMAGLAYLEGRLKVLELIDAYRGATAARLRMLDLALEAHMADIELERIIGYPLSAMLTAERTRP